MRALVRAEVLGLRSIRTPWLILLAAQAALVIGVVGLVANTDTSEPGLATKAVAHVGLVSLFSLVLGITAVAGEFRHRTITVAFLATPHRRPVLVAKLAVYTVLGLVSGLVSAAIAFAATAAALATDGVSMPTSDADLWWTLTGGVLWNAAFAAIGVGLGGLVRNQATAVGAALAWLALVEGLVAQLSDSLGRWLPFAAGQALGRLPGTDGLAPATAGVVLACYAAAFAVAGALALQRADVT
ncbi:ABC transporter permease subunit [Nocardioides sp.]|uniref:ABC transporter permease subunit n=1 Tax=Nocardioides sp. TaxID=35761 RepID=UPI002ED99DA8